LGIENHDHFHKSNLKDEATVKPVSGENVEDSNNEMVKED